MGITWEEKGSNVSTFWVCIIKPSCIVTYPPSQLLSTFTGAILWMAKRCAALAFTHGIAKASISTSFITFMTCPMVGIPKMMGTLTMNLEKVWDDQGYLIFVITLNSVHLNPLPSPTQATLAPMRLVISPTSRECSFTYLSVIVFTCTPLSRRAMQFSPFIFTFAMFSMPYHHWNGSRFKKGVCENNSMPPEPPVGVSLWCWMVLEGSGLPSPLPAPPSHLTASYPWQPSWVDNYE